VGAASREFPGEEEGKGVILEVNWDLTLGGLTGFEKANKKIVDIKRVAGFVFRNWTRLKGYK